MKFAQVSAALAARPGIVVACSGGCDSLLLADLAREVLPGRLRLVHVNHHLRPDASRDEALVRRWSSQHELPLQVVHLDPAALRNQTSGLEAAARAARYRALLEHTPTGWVLATGHHASDRLETLLLRLQQGAGLSGLAGPRPVLRTGGRTVVRPLLHLWRADLEREAARRNLQYVSDPSNLDLRHDRNRLRHEVIAPWLAQAAPASLARSLALIAAERRLLRQLVAERLNPLLQQTEVGWRLPRTALTEAQPLLACSLLREALRRTAGGRPSAAFVRSVVTRASRPGPFELHGEGLTLRAGRDWIEWPSLRQSV